MNAENKEGDRHYEIGGKVKFSELGLNIVVKRVKTTMKTDNFFVKNQDGWALQVVKKNNEFLVQPEGMINISPETEVEIVAFLP